MHGSSCEKSTKSWQKKRAPKATKPSDCLQQSPEHQHILAVLKIRNVVPLYWLVKNGIPHLWIVTVPNMGSIIPRTHHQTRQPPGVLLVAAA